MYKKLISGCLCVLLILSGCSKDTNEPEETFDTPSVRTLRTIGNENCGYLNIPDNFIELSDFTTDTNMQYGNDKCVFTLSVLSNVESMDDAVENVVSAMSDMCTSDIYNADVELSGYESKQLYGYYEDDDMFLVVDLIPVENNIIYSAAEFNSDNVQLSEYLDTYCDSNVIKLKNTLNIDTDCASSAMKVLRSLDFYNVESCVKIPSDIGTSAEVTNGDNTLKLEFDELGCLERVYDNADNCLYKTIE